MAEGPDKVQHVTLAQHEALLAELAELEGPRRAEVVLAIRRAREFGDLTENFEYHAAKNEQGLLERRITLLRARIESAVVIEAGELGGDSVAIGSLVQLVDEDGEALEVEISSVGGRGTASPDSPLGRALLGARVGDQVEVAAPSGAWTAVVRSIGNAPPSSRDGG
jgi:transcription elongation factor GreA